MLERARKLKGQNRVFVAFDDSKSLCSVFVITLSEIYFLSSLVEKVKKYLFTFFYKRKCKI